MKKTKAAKVIKTEGGGCAENENETKNLITQCKLDK